MKPALKRRLVAMAVWMGVRLPGPLHRNPLFDAAWYRSAYPDVVAARVDPYRHFRRHGLSEGRDPNAWFDTRWYLAEYPDVAAVGIDPLDHYLLHGAQEGRDPGPAFSTQMYLAENPDIRASGVNPLLHFLRHGDREGRTVDGRASGRRSTSYPPVRDFDDYLRLAASNPSLLRAPFPGDAQRIVDHMAGLRDQLAAAHASDPQDALVSVVVPAWDRAHLLPYALASVLDQSYRNLEIIVVDDGSSDDTPAVVRSFTDPRIRFEHFPTHRGQAHARNRGVELSTGVWVTHLDSDMTWHRDFVLIMLGEARRAGRDFAYSAQSIVRGADPDAQRYSLIRFAPFDLGLLERSNYVDTNMVIHTRDLIERTGGFDPQLTRLVDWDLFLRMSRTSPPLGVPVVLSTYTRGLPGRSVTRDEPLESNQAIIRKKTRRSASP